MKKLLAIILGILIISSISVTALAVDDTTGTGGTGSVTAPADTTDPNYVAVKQDYATIVALRQQEKDLRTQAVALTKSNEQLAQQIRDIMKQLREAAKNTAGDGIKAIKDELATLKQQRLALLQQIADAKLKKDTTTLASLKSQLEPLNAQIKADMQKLKDLAASENGKTLKDTVAQLNELNGKIDALKAQMAALEADIKTKQAQIDTDWSTFVAAMQSKDYGAADAALQLIIPIKQQSITDMNSIIGLKQQVAGLLNTFLSSLPTPSTGSGSR